MSTDDPHAGTVATIHAHRILRQSRTFHSATGRVSAADRNLTELLHPSMAAGLTKEQREKIHTARALIRSVVPELRELAGVASGATPDPVVPPMAPAVKDTPPQRWTPPPIAPVIPLRRRAEPLIRL